MMHKILLVDDEAQVRTLLRISLEHDGYDVEEAVNGRQALALHEEQPVDLVITDIAMPEMNGFDLIEVLTRKFVDIKVIAMSGLAENLAVAKLLGACEAVQKPLNIDQLLRMAVPNWPGHFGYTQGDNMTKRPRAVCHHVSFQRCLPNADLTVPGQRPPSVG